MKPHISCVHIGMLSNLIHLKIWKCISHNYETHRMQGAQCCYCNIMINVCTVILYFLFSLVILVICLKKRTAKMKWRLHTHTPAWSLWKWLLFFPIIILDAPIGRVSTGNNVIHVIYYHHLAFVVKYILLYNVNA